MDEERDIAIRRLCTVCARGGSSGVPAKNLRLLGGIPLIAHTVRQAVETGLFEHIAVSSDAPEILEVAREHGATMAILRPPELATDAAPKVPAILHCVQMAEQRAGARYDIVVDLDATAPLRLPADIAGAIRLLEDSDAPNVITACPARRSPYFNLIERREDGEVRPCKPLDPPLTRRQDAPRCWDMNASIYAWRRAALTNTTSVFLPGTALYEMPEHRSIDIDSEHDLVMVELLLPGLAPSSA